MKNRIPAKTEEAFQTFVVKLPLHVARRVRFCAVESEKSPEAYIGESVGSVIEADIDSGASPIVFDIEGDNKEINRLNPIGAPATLTIKLTEASMRRLTFVAGESGTAPEQWAADVLSDASTQVAGNIVTTR